MKQAGGVGGAIAMAREQGRQDALAGAVKISIQRSHSREHYFITVQAGEKIPEEWSDRGSIVAKGFPPENFLLIPARGDA